MEGKRERGEKGMEARKKKYSRNLNISGLLYCTTVYVGTIRGGRCKKKDYMVNIAEIYCTASTVAGGRGRDHYISRGVAFTPLSLFSLR